MTQSLAEEKNKLRSVVAKMKTQFRREQFMGWSGEIFKQIETLPRFISAHHIALYWSLPGEVFTHEFIQKWYGEKTIFLPAIRETKMQFKKYTGPDQMVTGTNLGISEPVGIPCQNLCDIEMIIVPGIAFDKSLNRMGRGMAYYDKFLSKVNSYKAGVCFDFQLMDSIPVTPQDIKMNCVITESNIY